MERNHISEWDLDKLLPAVFICIGVCESLFGMTFMAVFSHLSVFDEMDISATRNAKIRRAQVNRLL